MKKKILITAIAATVALSSMGALAACGDDSADAEIAQRAIATVRNLYADKAQETPIDYKVIARTKVDDEFYAINWSVSSSVENYGNYVAVGDADESNVTINIHPGAEAVEYTLTASVTVGSATETAEFKRKVPAAAGEHAGTAADPYEVANVREIGAGLASTKYYEENGEAKQIYVKGYVVDPGTANASAGRINNAYIVDEYAADKDKNSEGALNVYTLSYDTSVFTGQYPLRHGDLVVLTGFIQNYNGTIEITYKGSVSVTCVSLTPAADTRTAQEKAQAAVDAATPTTSSYTATGSNIALPLSSVRGVTLGWTVATNDYVTVTDNKLNIGSLPTEETTVTLTVTATVDGTETTATKTYDIKVAPGVDLGLEHAGTAADPYTVADANKILATLSSGSMYKVNGVDQEVYIKGYVTVGGSVGSSRLDNAYIADVAGTAQAQSLLVYGISWDAENLPEGTTLTVGDLVVIKGYLKDYNGTKEVAQSGSGASAVYPSIVSLTQAVDERTPQQKIAAVKETLVLDTSYSTSVDITLPKSNVRGVTLTWESDNALITIAQDYSKMTIGEIPEGSTTVHVTARLSCGEGDDAATDTKVFDITLSKEVHYDGEGTADSPYSVADVRKLLNTLGSDEYYKGEGETPVKVYIRGFVTVAGTAGTYGYNNVFVGATATASEAESVKVYRLNWDDTVWTKPNKIRVGDEVVVIGYLQNYGGNSKQVTYSGSDNPVLHSRVAVPVPDSEKVDDAKEAIKLVKTKYTEVGEAVLLPVATEGVTITWESNSTDIVGIVDGKLTVKSLPSTATTVTLTATVTVGTANGTKDVTITVVAPETPVATGTFKLKLQQVKLNKVLYFKGTINSSNFGETTENAAEASDVVIAQVSGGHTMKVGEKYLELNASNRLTLVDEPTAAWVYDYDLNVFTWTKITGKIYYLGTYGTFNTISASETSYISGSNATNVGVSQFVAQFVDLANRTDAQKIADALEQVKSTLDNITTTGDKALPTSTEPDVTFTWALATDNEATCATVTGGTTLNVSALPAANATVKLTVTATCGSATDTKNVSVVVEADLPAGAVSVAGTFANHAAKDSKGDLANGTQYTKIGIKDDNTIEHADTVEALTANVTVTVSGGGSNSGKYYDSGYEWRMYQNGATDADATTTPDKEPTITVAAKTGYKIYSIKLTFSLNNTGILVKKGETGTQYTSGESIIVNNTSMQFTVRNSTTATNGQVKISKIEVVYVPA